MLKTFRQNLGIILCALPLLLGLNRAADREPERVTGELMTSIPEITQAILSEGVSSVRWNVPGTTQFLTLVITTNLETKWTTFEEAFATTPAGRTLTNIVLQKQWGAIQTNRELHVLNWGGKPGTNILKEAIGREALPSASRTNRAAKK